METRIFFSVLFLLSSFLLAQDQQDPEQEARSGTTETKTNIIKEEDGEFNKIARIKIKDSIKLKDGKYYKIDSVRIDITDGMLNLVHAYLEKGKYFYNRHAPIAIIYPDRLDGPLHNRDGESINVNDILEVDVFRRFGFLPDNYKMILLTNSSPKGKNYVDLTKSNILSSLVNIVAYSDLLGLLGDEANALVHFEANAKFYIHRHVGKRFMYFGSSIKPSFNFNKLDSKFDTIRTIKNRINPTEIFRRHSYSVGFEVSLWKWDFRPANSLELRGGYQYLSTKLIILDKDKNDNDIENEIRAVNHLRYVDLAFESKIFDNFGMELSMGHYWQTLNKSAFYDRSTNTMIGFKGSIYYYPPKSKGADKVYLRFSNFLVNKSRELDFSQLQIGFSKSLNQLPKNN